jgi:uncharacterized protein YndB with AHSA1/START domain
LSDKSHQAQASKARIALTVSLGATNFSSKEQPNKQRGIVKSGDEPIVVEQTFDATIDTVWKAITQIDLMRQWYFDNIPSFRPEVGFETQFNVRSQDRDFLHMWRVTEVAPLQKLAYRWRFAGLQGESVAVFELFRKSDLTTLKSRERAVSGAGSTSSRRA